MYYPVMVKVSGEPCLVVGGGRVALRKARALRRVGADLTIVSPSFIAGLGRVAARRIRRAFRAGDVAGKVLVIAATDDPGVNRTVYRACRKRGIPVNVVDVPELCSFIVPAVVRRGPVTVAISTGGLSPSLAKALRRRLETLLPASIGQLAHRLGKKRKEIMNLLPPSAARTKLLKDLLRDADAGGASRP